MEITDEEREAGTFVIRHRFGSHNVQNRTVANLWELEPKTLIAMSKWRKLATNCPETFKALRRWFAIERISAIAGMVVVKTQRQAAKKAPVRMNSEQASLWGRR